MNVNLICKGKPIIEVVQLGAALEDRGCRVSILNPSFSLEDLRHDRFWTPFLECDLTYYRTGFGDAARTVYAGKLANIPKPVINRAAIQNQLLANKVFQAIHAQQVGVPVPKTLIGRHLYEDVVTQLGARFVLKAANGIQGTKVFLVETKAQYEAQVAELPGDILCQEMIPNTGDYRVFVLAGEVVEIYKRVPKDGDFRANMSQGGHGEAVTDSVLRADLSRMALAVSTKLKLDITGIDIIQHAETGALSFIEANVNPGWKGLDQTLGTDTSSTIADWFMAVGRGEQVPF